MAFFGRKSPFEALVSPGVMLACKYNQFRQRRREAQSKKVTERELTALHHKIDSRVLSCTFISVEISFNATLAQNQSY
ncbi:CLUMA_CG009072, isoform A [Clunio marinus]|uniref:CLUMA_CG009072, isoform A n=1 Tax=Clunio marinus TaxID=568069 RepID=A0A1J1I5P4_9DIPT|nr:CLUMA_CG009072, isoform A [Clunio marinus]